MHRLSGIVTPANASYTSAELLHQLKSSGARSLITCASLYATASAAAKRAGISDDRIYIIDIPGEQLATQPKPTTLDDLIARGRSMHDLDPLIFHNGQGRRQTAFLCYSSGTPGLMSLLDVPERES